MPSGSCWCGNVKYEFEGDSSNVILCHCLSCQKITGMLHTANIPVARDKLTITSGSPKSYTQKHEDGFKLTVFFCDNCGSALYKQGDAEMFAPVSLVQAGTLDGPAKDKVSAPSTELNVKLRASWLAEVRGAAQKQGFD
ncbi:Mss4-like protein [Trichoderma novae-zelandiae]